MQAVGAVTDDNSAGLLEQAMQRDALANATAATRALWLVVLLCVLAVAIDTATDSRPTPSEAQPSSSSGSSDSSSAASAGAGAKRLPKCGLYSDTYGGWVPTAAVSGNPALQAQHFYGPGPSADSGSESHSSGSAGWALQWDQVWLPKDCSYHRFTAETLRTCTQYNIEHRPKPPNGGKEKESRSSVFEVSLMGDSALRGITCGITRIAGGNE